MNILYLSEDYTTSKVHHELISRLTALGHTITVYSVIRPEDIASDISKTYSSVDYEICTYFLSQKWELVYRLLFNIKKKIKYNNLVRKLNPQAFDMVHAATLYSEGIIAYELFKKYNIPYTVAIRGTDVGLYLSKMPHLWHVGQRILKNASKVIFISPIILSKFKEKKAIHHIFSQIEQKCIIIPNGLEDFWISNRSEKATISFPRNILYIGRFDKNKNVERLVKAVIELKLIFPDIKLNMVGGGDKCHDRIMGYCKKYPETISYLGKIYDKPMLLDVIRENHIFAMVSHSETFGLVYLEALSQGLPILYTSGQGIDASVPDCVGEKTKSNDQSDITHKLKKIIENYSNYQQLGDSVLEFSWDNIAKKYSNIFKQIYN